MKRIILPFLLMLLPMMASADAVEINGIYYNLIMKAKQAEVTKKPSGYYSGAIEIPDTVIYEGSEYSVTSIGKSAFYWCRQLTSVTIQNSVTSIGQFAFKDCISLSSVTIPNSVTSIGEYTFSGCSGLTSITIPNNVTLIDDFAFSDCTSLSSITIPNSVTSIGWRAFSNCPSLTSITIPNNVTSIRDYAFSGCTGLTSITIPNNVTSINGYTFNGCTGLTSIVIPNSVSSIGSSAFDGCSGLTSVTIGSGVNNIYDNAFANCDDLTDVYCLAENVPSTYASAFDGSYIEYAKLHVPASAINAYNTTPPWSGFGEFVTISGEEMPKCATPTISFENGKFKFSCETEGVEYVSEISSVDAGNKYTDEVDITGKITVRVYATKSGCLNSDTATAVIEAPGELKGDLNKDGTVNVADHVELTKIIMGQE